MAIFHKAAPGVKQPHGGSSRHHKEVGSGARPTKSAFGIETSAPMKPRHLDSRHVKGALGVK